MNGDGCNDFRESAGAHGASPEIETPNGTGAASSNSAHGQRAGERRGMARRPFLIAGASAMAFGASALSYRRIIGANDRIYLGLVGAGRRGRELASVVAGIKDEYNVEMAAICDLWKVNRELGVETARQVYARPPLASTDIEDLAASSEIDAVIIATADFQHAPMIKLFAEAGKDIYSEKPMATEIEDARAARNAVRSRDLVVQMGTQHRSEAYQNAVKETIRRGDLGEVSKVEIVWNYHGPRWRGRPEVNEIREE